MSSTAEELSSQAMQLQEAIAFFKIDGVSARRNAQTVKPATLRHGLLKPTAIKKQTEAPKAIKGPESMPGRQSGVLIDLNEDRSAGDATDEDFTRY